jgi:hypothetical protein
VKDRARVATKRVEKSHATGFEQIRSDPSLLSHLVAKNGQHAAAAAQRESHKAVKKTHIVSSVFGNLFEGEAWAAPRVEATAHVICALALPLRPYFVLHYLD